MPQIDTLPAALELLAKFQASIEFAPQGDGQTVVNVRTLAPSSSQSFSVDTADASDVPAGGELVAALALLAEHGGEIQMAHIDGEQTEITVWFASADVSAKFTVDGTDGEQIGRVIVRFAEQFREQFARRN